MKTQITVLGAGSWGTAVALLLAEKGLDVLLWAHGKTTFHELSSKRVNTPYLPGIPLSPKITPVHSLKEATSGATDVLLSVPSHTIRGVVSEMKSFLTESARIISLSKGIENQTLKLPSQILDEVLPASFSQKTAFLSGPTFAKEVAEKKPAAATITSKTPETAVHFQELLNTDYFRTYTNHDVTGVELGGALKNIMAIAAGVSDGMGNGNNARSALITRGLAEIIRIGKALGANPLTFSGLSGIGDLVLTCTGDLSRNRHVGIQLGKGKTLKNILLEMNMVAEGVKTSKSAYTLASNNNVSVPIITSVYKMLYENKTPQKAMHELMKRGLKQEFP